MTTVYVYYVYPVISKSPKQLSNCLKIAETSIVLVAFNCVICDVSTYIYCYRFFLLLYKNQVPEMLY